jgi:hypothetical protein
VDRDAPVGDRRSRDESDTNAALPHPRSVRSLGQACRARDQYG